MTRSIEEVSNQFVKDAVAVSPMLAVYLGMPSGGAIDDYSPAGLEERFALASSALAAAKSAPIETERDRVALDVLAERLQLGIERYEAGDDHSALNVIASPLQDVRMMFDLLPRDSDDHYADMARRMAAVPDAFDGYQQSLREGVKRGRVSAVRQIDKCAEQCDKYAGVTSETGFFANLASTSGRTGALADELTQAAATADAAYAELGRFLREELREHAPAKDAVGRDAYALASRDFLGAAVDLEETYAWGWEEFLGLEAELKAVCARIRPGASPREVADLLDDDPRYQVTGTDGLQRWMQNLSD